MRTRTAGGSARGWVLQVLLGAAGVLGAQAPLAAQGATQVLRGIVRDVSGSPIAGAQISVDAQPGTAESDSLGRFTVSAPGDRDRVLRVRRIGFLPDSLRIAAGAAAVDLSLVLLRAPQRIRPIIVEAREKEAGPLAGFYRRMATGQGRYFSAAEIERRRFVDMVHLMNSIPGVSMERARTSSSIPRFRGDNVPAEIFLDGVPLGEGGMDLNHFEVTQLAGVEVYRGQATVPPEFALGRTGPTRSGVIAIWTQPIEPRTKKRKPSDPTAVALVREMVAEGRAYTDAQVDSLVSVATEDVLLPVYPESLLVAGTSGLVFAEFVVDARGNAIPETFSVILSTHPAFSAAVRRAVLAQAFIAAQKDGKRVAQLVQQPFEFSPPSGRVPAVLPRPR